MQSTFWLGTSWKMNKTLNETQDYVRRLAAGQRDFDRPCQLFIVPPHTSLAQASKELIGTSILVGAQNMHWATKGAYTGEISADMIRSCGASLVELGHSERRAAFGETDETVNLKVLAALRAGLCPLICVGDTAQERNFDVSVESVVRQVKIALHGVKPEQYRHALIAYEPVWAIGNAGTAAQPSYVNTMHLAIRKALARMSAETANIPILYGGSVNVANAVELSRQPEVNGLFIGRAAWNVVEFLKIVHDVMSDTPPEKKTRAARKNNATHSGSKKVDEYQRTTTDTA